MAIITIGPFLDPEIDLPRTIQLEVRDEGELTKLPSFGNELVWTEISFGSQYGLGSHEWVQIGYELWGRPILFCHFYVERRAEWVCFIFNSDNTNFGYAPREGSNSEPYEVNEAFMGGILYLYGIPHLFGIPSKLGITPELKRCHPDILREISTQLNGEIDG